MGEQTLQNLTAALPILQAIFFVVAIIASVIAGLFHLRKLAPGWHTNAAFWIVALGPTLLMLAAIYVSVWWRKPFIAGALFAAWFLAEGMKFARDSAPLTRASIFWFGLLCCTFVFSVVVAFVGDVLQGILSVLDHQTDLMGKIIEQLRRQ